MAQFHHACQSSLLMESKLSSDEMCSTQRINSVDKSSPTSGAGSPVGSVNGSLTDAGSMTPSIPSVSTAPVFKSSDTLGPPTKKRKLTFAEREEQQVQKQIKEAERTERRAKAQLEKFGKEQTKAQREAEREAERLQREAKREEKRLLRDALEAEKEAVRRAKDEERRKKDTERLHAEEARLKKERAQPKLNSFFSMPIPLQKKEVSKDGAEKLPSPVKVRHTELSEYGRQFPPFFQHDHVRLASSARFPELQRNGTEFEARLDNDIRSSGLISRRPAFDPANLFNCPSVYLCPRGRHFTAVRHIMDEKSNGSTQPCGTSHTFQDSQARQDECRLRSVPYKIISFQQDTRPAYNGTVTSQPVAVLQKVARKPTEPLLPELNYDYDSEAEWVDDVEDGEDLDSVDGEEEDGLDGEEDMDGFLDDADEQASNLRRTILSGDLEPQSTGLCWEDASGGGTLPSMNAFRLEIVHANLSVKAPIDPFATHYWEQTPSKHATMEPPRKPLSTVNGSVSNVMGTKMLMESFIDITNKPDLKTTKTWSSDKKMIQPEDYAAFIDQVDGSDFTKLALIDLIHKRMRRSTKVAVKDTLEMYALREGKPKRWKITDLTRFST